MHYYQHNIADYRCDTAHLSLLEHGVYRQLLDMYYLSESPIPRETQHVFRRLSARTQDEQSAVEIILNEFFSLSEEGWIHKRCDIEIADYRHKAVNSRENGKKGGRPKPITEPEKTQQVILDNPEHNLNEPELINALTNKPINQDTVITHTVYPSQQSREPTPAASVCLELKKIGIVDVNPSHPKLGSLIKAGAMLDEFIYAARTAKDKGKGFAYVLGVVEGRRNEAAQTGGFVGKHQRSPPSHGKQAMIAVIGNSIFGHRDKENGHEREVDGTAEFFGREAG